MTQNPNLTRTKRHRKSYFTAVVVWVLFFPDLLHSQGGRCTRQASCLRWWLYRAPGPAGWGLWRNFLGGKRRIPWRAGFGTPPTGPAGLLRDRHTDGRREDIRLKGGGGAGEATLPGSGCARPTLAKLAVKRTHSKSSPIFWRNSSTWGLLSTYTWNTTFYFKYIDIYVNKL